MDSRGFKHLTGCSVSRDENCTNSKVFSEKQKNKLSENVIVHLRGPIQKNTEITKL
jgi:hypothetical protein